METLITEAKTRKSDFVCAGVRLREVDQPDVILPLPFEDQPALAIEVDSPVTDSSGNAPELPIIQDPLDKFGPKALF